MFNSYPEDIRKWLRERGGLAVGNVVAPAKDLWAMGYHKCGPDYLESENERRWKERDAKAEELWKEWQKTLPPDPEPADSDEIPIPMTIIQTSRF
jgi:hypothetical protein